ncbi:hypothetical protein ASPWEDRAFT_28927 [Aspergillus wentii DTO 134E9]|uniref:Glucose-methanol-choline oxidoreductase N-terminal domain-containing protein n=1 Tax=Aspergillus wentii DTO 134E9 TaxID=1073089 RepID=A0A1L9RFM4_ASPWE|nr:uncharacterized protein ASPWEDRAFT_28927 [Aspergillus wentii DTO 134E9]OJJ33726.1 hypothetical protein ASPWEDRAFT_28927 [Aspergillus wentii DTO 134E9]
MRSFLAGGVVALSSLFGVAAAGTNSSAYTDSASGMEFQRWCDDDTGFCFGIALPETVKSDFIGQLDVPLSNSKGWGGVSLMPSMLSSLMIAAWPNGDSGVATIRKTTSYANPDVFDGDASVVEIPDATSVNSTHLTYTFLCSGCILGSPSTFTADSDTYFFGWALSKTNPTTPSSPSSKLQYHAAGFGTMEMLLSEAKSSKYSTWASKAKSTSTSGSNSAASSSAASSTASKSAAPSVKPTISSSTYDYIVVGGGPAGIIAAERLAETKKSVLLIERGAASTVPTGANDTLSWNDTLTAYDVPALGSSISSLGLLGDYLCDDTAGMAGCVLGGGTIINAMSYIYPQSADFDDKWPSGWKWNDIQDAAKRMYERNPGSMLPSADGKRYDQGLYTVLSKFFSGLGWKSVSSQEQPNEKHQVFSYPSWSVGNGIRAGPVRTYLPLVEDLDNFTLRLHTKVRRVIRSGGKITGVEVDTASGGIEIINVNAGGKVILAAGSMSTPRVLFNSGIGPVKQIQTVKNGKTGITLPAQKDWISLPVGYNLKDHPMFTVTVNTNSNFTHFNTSSVIPGPNEVVQKLFAQGSGAMTQGGHRLQFWTSNVGSDGNTRYYQGSCSTSEDGVITMKLYLTHGATSSGVLGIDASGSTVIQSDPWLQTDADKQGVTEFLNELISGFKNSTDGFYMPDYSTASDIIGGKTSGDHFVGTTKMGTDDGRRNGSSVVDTNAKVYGTENLFVVDASIHPDLPTGNTQAIVQIAAEAAVARIIKLGKSSAAVSSVAASSPAVNTAYAPSSTVAPVTPNAVTVTSTAWTTTTDVVTVTQKSTTTVTASSLNFS